MATRTEKIKASLEPLLNEAEKAGLWLSAGPDHCFSAQELRDLNSAGRFLWGPSNWTLIDPEAPLLRLRRRAEDAQKELDQFYIRYIEWKGAREGASNGR